MFKELKTEEDAYWFGYLMADGYNHISGRMIQFTQAEQDKEMVYKLKEYMGFGHVTVTTFDDPKRQSLYMLSLYSRELCDNLSKLGCINKKSLVMTMPNIQYELFWHFLRGYFDGDGCLYSKIRNDGALVVECPIVGSNDFSESLQDILKTQGIQTYKQKLGLNKLCTTIKVAGVLNNAKFLKCLYRNASICSPRKYTKYIQFKNDLMQSTSTHKKTKEAQKIIQDQ